MILRDHRGNEVFVCPLHSHLALAILLIGNTFAYLATETAQAFWGTLIPHGLHGGALAHIHSTDDDDDDDMGEGGGWKEEYVQWWFDFLAEKGGKGVSKDTWVMVSRLLPVALSIMVSRNVVTLSYPVHRICAHYRHDVQIGRASCRERV